MIFGSKKGRTKVLGSKFSRNSYFSRSRLIVWPSALRHLIFASIWAIWQKLCWNCLFSEFCDRDYMSVCLFLSFLFCGSDVSASMLLFVALLCHETWCVALIKLWWLCHRVSYRKPGGVQKRAPMGGQIQALPGTSVSKKLFVTYYSWRCRNVVLDPRQVTENGPAPGPYKTHASTTKNWPAKRDPNWPRWRTQFLVTRARPINHFFEKKLHNFSKKLFLLDTSKSKIKFSGGSKKWT